MRKSFLFFTLLACWLVAGAQNHFSKYLTNSPVNSSFDVIVELNDHSGYLILGTHYTPNYTTILIKTDSALHAVWTRSYTFPSPFTNANFRGVGEFPTGEYYLVGSCDSGYVVLSLDTSGTVLHQKTIRETSHIATPGWYANDHICADSSLLIAPSEYEWAGFYRFDHQLNLLSSGFSMVPSQNSNGHDCIMLADHNLVYASNPYSAKGIIKCDLQGNIIWSKLYSNNVANIFSLYESPDHSIYAGGWTSDPALMKFDSTGQLLWERTYTVSPANTGNQAIRRIFPMTNGHLLLFTDSLFFEADTAGYPLNPAYSYVQHYNLGELRTAGPDFLLCSILVQANSGAFPTIIRFNTPSGSLCLHPQSLIPTTEALALQPVTVQQQTPQFHQGSPSCTTNIINFGYDPVNGCPPDPLGIQPVNPEPSPLLYPNPASDELVVSLPSGTSNRTRTVSIMDYSGKIILTIATDENSLRLNTSALAPGIYFARIMQEGNLLAAERFSIVR